MAQGQVPVANTKTVSNSGDGAGSPEMRPPGRAGNDLSVSPEQPARSTERLGQGLLGREARRQGMAGQPSFAFGEQAPGQTWGPGEGLLEAVDVNDEPYSF
jgi:hypothetical protein